MANLANTAKGVGAVILFPCDPALHVHCSKANCHINGGECTSTRDVRFAKQPVKKVRMVLPTEEDADEGTEL